MEFTSRELQIIEDRDFHMAKANILAKVRELLLITRTKLKKVLAQSSMEFPNKTSFKTGKISKGENYMGQPYMVLDFPAIFSLENTFAYRTMFWWGNFFSMTLHLQGSSLEYYRRLMVEKVMALENQHIYIGVGKTPWQYHYERDNYEFLNGTHAHYIETCSFLKLSRKVELAAWKDVPTTSSGFFSQLLEFLNI